MEEEKSGENQKKESSHHDDKITSHKEKKKLLKKVRANPWIVATIFLGIAVVALIFVNHFSVKEMSSQEVGDYLLNYYESNGVSGLTLNSVTEVSGVYLVTFDYQGNAVPLYATKDGKFVGSMSILPSAENKTETTDTKTETKDVPKSDKPVVELFVMSFCPYGTQAEKGLIPAIKALGNSVDFKLRFVYYSMHPSAGEVEENLREYCIQKVATDKFLAYMECFLEGSGTAASGGYITSGNDPAACIKKAGISSNSINGCVSEMDAKFSVTKNLNNKSSWMSGTYPKFDVDKDLNTKYSVGGSPTLVINGETVNPSSRSPAAFLSSVCAAFTDGKAPAVCSTAKLSTATPTPYFGWGESSGSTGTGAACDA
jgi:hypothetical protein